jgi:hypothetical protein
MILVMRPSSLATRSCARVSVPMLLSLALACTPKSALPESCLDETIVEAERAREARERAKAAAHEAEAKAAAMKVKGTSVDPGSPGR